ncbi:MAG: gliding motility lipoprotein GldD [Weeksellaceae bacterium]|nr:gliding motility lipoprotein GldD [Weeksellaceae bacterium]MDX9704865.1 gliding motility lipoprotein GldD [Weeksellaceae bacterium]
MVKTKRLSKMEIKKLLFFIGISIVFFSCNEKYSIKPIGEVRLEYPEPIYQEFFSENCPFSFDYSLYSRKIERNDKNCWFVLDYPDMKANIYLTYFPIESREDLATKIKDSEKFVQDQTVKASFISPREFVFEDKKVYGTLFELGGESAINLQFHATDSVKNIISGSVYFSTPPKYDSLRPAIQYMKRDLVHLIETLHWK